MRVIYNAQEVREEGFYAIVYRGSSTKKEMAEGGTTMLSRRCTPGSFLRGRQRLPNARCSRAQVGVGVFVHVDRTATTLLTKTNAPGYLQGLPVRATPVRSGTRRSRWAEEGIQRE